MITIMLLSSFERSSNRVLYKIISFCCQKHRLLIIRTKFLKINLRNIGRQTQLLQDWDSERKLLYLVGMKIII